jgi:hypothetical protein
MKNLFLILLIVCATSTILITSCLPNQCKQRAVDCQNGGMCRDGDCECAAGYEGDSCQNEANKKFIARYACVFTTTLDGGAPYYNDDTLVFKRGATKNDVLFYSVRDSLNQLKAKVTNTTINIQSQEVNSQGSIYNTYGTGSVNDKILQLTMFQNYTIPAPALRKSTIVGYKIE